MKRLIFIPLLIFSISLSAQFTKGGGMFLKTGGSFMTATVPPVDYTAEYDTVLLAFGSAPVDSLKTIQNALVYSLDSAGYWDRMDLLYVFAGHNSTDALINWIDPGTYDSDNQHSTAWTIYEGFTGDGANDYISTNWNPHDNGVNYTINDCAVGVYLRIDQQSNVAGPWGVRDGATNRMYLLPRNTSNYTQGALNSTDVYNKANSNSTGLFIVSRTASDAINIYRNGSGLGTETDASTGIPDAELTILQYGGIGSFSSNQVAIFFVMDGVVDATEAGKINTIIERYMDALETGVE